MKPAMSKCVHRNILANSQIKKRSQSPACLLNKNSYRWQLPCHVIHSEMPHFADNQSTESSKHRRLILLFNRSPARIKRYYIRNFLNFSFDQFNLIKSVTWAWKHTKKEEGATAYYKVTFKVVNHINFTMMVKWVQK